MGKNESNKVVAGVAKSTHTATPGDILVTVIIPVYNVAEHVGRTLASVAAQTYSDFEVVMVDDGSSDGSPDICKSFESDGRFKYYRKENGGLSSARNFGLMHAMGEYVTFLDGDDLLAPNAIKTMLSLALANDVQLVSCAYRKIRIGEAFYGTMESDFHVCKSAEHLEMLLLLDGETGSACGKLIRKSLYQYLSFPEGQLFEDFGVIANLIDKAEKSVVSRSEVYGYTTRPGSITGKRRYGPNHVEGMKSSLSVLKQITEQYPSLSKSFSCYEAFSYVRIASKLARDLCPNDDYYKGIIKKAKSAAAGVLSSQNVSSIWRMRCLLFAISRKAYNATYILYGKLTGKVAF